MYSIDVESSYEELWRYNIIVMCGGYSASQERLYVTSQEDIISPVGSSLDCEPEGYKLPHVVSLNAAKADNIRAIIYLVPHTLPRGKEVAAYSDFDLEVTVTRGKKIIYQSTHKANQWGGASIEIKL